MTDPPPVVPFVATGTPSIDGGATVLQDKGSSDKKAEDIVSSKENKSAVKCINGGRVTLSDLPIATNGNTTSLPESSFYGLNSAVLIQNTGEAILNRVKINTKGIGASGVFTMGKGASATMTDTAINTEGDSACGLMSTYDASLFATTTDIKTMGAGAFGVGTGHGGGTISMTGGSVATEGVNAPAIHSTGVVALTGTTASAVNSEAAVIDGKSTLLVTGGSLSSLAINAIKIFDSGMSGVPNGTGTFKMVGGKISSTAGAMFYVTNTTANIELQSVSLKNVASTLISCTSSGSTVAGISDKGGGNAVFSASSQLLSGSVYCDNLSTADVRLLAGTAYTGTINGENTGKAVHVTLDATSSWTLTGTSYVTTFSDKLGDFSNIKDGGFDILYDSKNKANHLMDGKTFALPEGGRLMPAVSESTATDTTTGTGAASATDTGAAADTTTAGTTAPTAANTETTAVAPNV